MHRRTLFQLFTYASFFARPAPSVTLPTIYIDPWAERQIAHQLMERGHKTIEIRLTANMAEELREDLPEINRNRAAVGLPPLFDRPNGWTSGRNAQSLIR